MRSGENGMKKKPVILVVDDERLNRVLMLKSLELQGYSVLLAEDGEQALGIVKETPVDLILLDVMMPRMNGFEVCAHLKENEVTRVVPVVMVTGLDDLEYRVKALDAGADDFLSKPVDMTELKARVRSLLKVKEYNDYQQNYRRELEDEISRRTEQLRKAHSDLQSASLDTIYRLSRAAEYKDEHTGSHLQRMSRYAVAIARRLGLPDETVEAILYAAPMHDVGKIGIPDRILLKPGKLDEQEWELMKQHTIIGARILEGSSQGFIKMAEIIAMTHHERWDGKGYPASLAGTDIPLVGRIVALADVFDALTSKRSYKEAFTVESSMEIIRKERGAHFEPEIVDAFFDVEPEILVIRERYKIEGESLLVTMVGSV